MFDDEDMSHVYDASDFTTTTGRMGNYIAQSIGYAFAALPLWAAIKFLPLWACIPTGLWFLLLMRALYEVQNDIRRARERIFGNG